MAGEQARKEKERRGETRLERLSLCVQHHRGCITCVRGEGRGGERTEKMVAERPWAPQISPILRKLLSAL